MLHAVTGLLVSFHYSLRPRASRDCGKECGLKRGAAGDPLAHRPATAAGPCPDLSPRRQRGGLARACSMVAQTRRTRSRDVTRNARAPSECGLKRGGTPNNRSRGLHGLAAEALTWGFSARVRGS